MRMKNEKVLIIKLGYSETLVNEVGRTASLGDVLRSTPLLDLYKEAHVTWLVDEGAVELLKGNRAIDRILTWDLTTVLQLQAESFDTIINLEKVAGVCAFSDSLKAWRRYGFRFNPDTGDVSPYEGSQHALELSKSHEDKVANVRYWEEILFEMVGAKWQGEAPKLGYKPKTKIKFHIGFNHNVGRKWPTKAWPKEHWKKLEALVEGKYTVDWQQGLDSLEDYIDWVNTVKLLVTNDSLGLHIAHALGKKVIAMFGPTLSNEVYIKDGVKLLPAKDYDCMPCMSGTCVLDATCMHDISPETVYGHVAELLEEKGSTKKNKARK